MNTTVLREWLKRLFGWGLPIVSGMVTIAVTSKSGDPSVGAAVGGAVAAVGAAVATKAIPYIIPDASKVAAANQMPKPLPPKWATPGRNPDDILRK